MNLKQTKYLFFIPFIIYLVSCSNNTIDSDEEGEWNKNIFESKLNTTALKIAAFGSLRTESDAMNIAHKSWSNTSSRSTADQLILTHTEWIRSETNLSSKSSKSNYTSDSLAIYFIYNPILNKTSVIAGSIEIPEVLADFNGSLTTQTTNMGYDVVMKLLLDQIRTENNHKSYNNKELEEIKNTILFATQENGNTDIIFTPKQSQRTSRGKFGEEDNGPVPFLRMKEYSIILEDSKIEPLINVSWGQGIVSETGDAYNSATPTIKCNGQLVHPYTGCVAVAMAQIMSFHKREILSTDQWNKVVSQKDANYLNPNDQKSVSLLMRALGSGVSMNYGCKSSGANINKANDFFKFLSYKTDNVKDFDPSKVISSIQNHRPVYMRGEDPIEGGHAWVADGCERYRYRLITKYYKFIGNGFPNSPIDEMEWEQVSYSEEEKGMSYIYYNYGWQGHGDGKYMYYDHTAKDQLGNPILKFKDIKTITNIR